MESIKPEVRRRVIADFYRRNITKGKSYTVMHFKKMDYAKSQIYEVMKRVDAGESIEQPTGVPVRRVRARWRPPSGRLR